MKGSLPALVGLAGLAVGTLLPFSSCAAPRSLLASCSRGDLAACHALLSRPRLSPGVRAAIELHMEEMAAGTAACRSLDSGRCREFEDPPPAASRAPTDPRR